MFLHSLVYDFVKFTILPIEGNIIEMVVEVDEISVKLRFQQGIQCIGMHYSFIIEYTARIKKKHLYAVVSVLKNICMKYFITQIYLWSSICHRQTVTLSKDLRSFQALLLYYPPDNRRN